MSSCEEITKTFIKTYYEIISTSHGESPRILERPEHDKPQLFQLYEPHAQISRNFANSASASYSFKLINEPLKDVCPDDLVNSINTILNYNGTKVNDNILVNVYGSFNKTTSYAQGFWTQEFLLQKYKARWFIIYDTFFSFNSPNITLIGAEQPLQQIGMPMQTVYAPPQAMPQQIPAPVQQIPQKSSTPAVSPDFRPQQNPSANPGLFSPQYQTSRDMPSMQKSYNQYQSSRNEPKRQRFDSYDPARSITITVNGKYQGDDVANYYANYGEVAGKFYTHNTVYIKFCDKNAKDAALAAPPPVINGVTAKVDDGIINKNQRGRPR